MKTVFNCSKHLDTENAGMWDETRELIDRKYEHLVHLHPDLDRAELHLAAKKGESEVHLIVHDSKHRQMEAHAQHRHLHAALLAAFKRAERQLAKPKHLQRTAA